MTGNCGSSAAPEKNNGCAADNETTLIYGTEQSGSAVSPGELRQELQLPDGSSISDYGTLHTIGIGGMGAVFSARDPGLKREVALKILRPQFRQDIKQVSAFIREARATARIDHPNIVPVHHIGIFDEVGVYFSMKRVEGETLRTILGRLAADHQGYRRKYTLPRLLEIFIGVCNGVAFAHRHGIIHRDLKPGNLMIGDYGEVMVMDWGMSAYRSDLDTFSSDLEKSSRENDFAFLKTSVPADGKAADDIHNRGGTLAFMPPERIGSGQDLTPSVQGDIYSLGCILYSMLTWRPAPFDIAAEPEKLAAAIYNGNYPSPRRIAPAEQPSPRELEAICLKAMAAAPDRRYASVEDMLEDLRNYLAGYPVKAYSPTLLYRFGKMVYRHPLIPAVLAAAAVTWVSFSMVLQFGRMVANSSLFNTAQHHYTLGRGFEDALVKRLNNLNISEQNEGLRSSGEDPAAHNLQFHMKSNYDNALESLLQMQEKSDGYLRRAYVLGGEICHRILNVCLRTGRHNMLPQELDRLRNRNRQFFTLARSANHRLDALAEAIEHNTGYLTITLPGNAAGGWNLRITPVGSDNLPDHGQAVEITAPATTGPIELHAGDYILSFIPRQGSTLTFPVSILPADSLDFFFEPPPEKYPHMACIPATRRHSGPESPVEKSFLISLREVTIGEYLEFWRQLSDRKLREQYRAYYRSGGSHDQPAAAWNDRGELAPGLSAALPVAGIPFAAAEAYCRYLGSKLNITVRLPYRREWETAARGNRAAPFVWQGPYRRGAALLADHPDAGKYPAGAPPGTFAADRSVFGLYDMTGNVREWLASPPPRKMGFAIAGGSHASPPGFARIGLRQYSVDGAAADDIGFRCVYEISDSGRRTGKNSVNSLAERQKEVAK